MNKFGGQLKKNYNKVEVEEFLELKDQNDKSARFSPLAIITHHGGVSGNTTFGHYVCDVFNNTSNQWFRTSDASTPEKISFDRISQHGYIFLYKKC